MAALLASFGRLSLSASVASVSSRPMTTSCHLLPGLSLTFEQRRTGKHYTKVPRPGNPKLRSNTQYKWDFGAVMDEVPAYTHKPLHVPRLGGRDPLTGVKKNQRVGGGIKWDFFAVDMNRRGPSVAGSYYEERVLEVRNDPNRTAHIAMVAGSNGRRWILSTANMKPGQIIKTSSFVPKVPIVNASEGDAYPVGALGIGTKINTIEKFPGRSGNRMVVNAGGFATIVRHEDNMVVIQLSTKREFGLRPECMATVGQLSNIDHAQFEWDTPNNKRRSGRKQASGVWHRKDGYCGRKIHPLPPMQTLDMQPEAPRPLRITLTKAQMNAQFGTNKLVPILSDGNYFDPEKLRRQTGGW